MENCEVKQRRCLKCSDMFRSRGPGNRICRSCSKVNARLDLSEAQLQRERGVKRHNGEVIESTPSEPMPGELALTSRQQELSA